LPDELSMIHNNKLITQQKVLKQDSAQNAPDARREISKE